MVPTDEAIITRQMLYSALPVPPTAAAFAMTSSIYPQLTVLFPSAKFRLPSIAIRRVPSSSRFHWIKPGIEKTTTCAPVTSSISRRRASHILPVKRDIRAGRRRGEITLYSSRGPLPAPGWLRLEALAPANFAVAGALPGLVGLQLQPQPDWTFRSRSPACTTASALCPCRPHSTLQGRVSLSWRRSFLPWAGECILSILIRSCN